jgi:hypothetical protein
MPSKANDFDSPMLENMTPRMLGIANGLKMKPMRASTMPV